MKQFSTLYLGVDVHQASIAVAYIANFARSSGVVTRSPSIPGVCRPWLT